MLASKQASDRISQVEFQFFSLSQRAQGRLGVRGAHIRKVGVDDLDVSKGSKLLGLLRGRVAHASADLDSLFGEGIHGRKANISCCAKHHDSVSVGWLESWRHDETVCGWCV